MPFSFAGRIGRLPYALWSLAAFFSQHLVVVGLMRAMGRPLSLDATFLIMPLRSMTVFDKTSVLTLPLALAFALSAEWALAALAFRRAADAGFTEWVAAYAIVPVIQIPLFAVLCVAPPRVARDPRPPVGDDAAEPMSWIAVTQGGAGGSGLDRVRGRGRRARVRRL